MATRRELLRAAAGVTALLVQRLVLSQTTRKVKIVAILSIANAQRVGRQMDAILQGMRDFGWIEGQNIEYRMSFADGDMQRLDALAADLVAQKVDVIVVGGSVDARAAQRSTTSIPIVMASASNAVGSGLISSLARPGGNITGISGQYEDSMLKLFQILHEAVPDARRIAVLINEDSPAHTAYWASAQDA